MARRAFAAHNTGMGGLIGITVLWIVLALAPFPFAGLPRCRFAVGLFGSLGLAAEALLIAVFGAWLGSYQGDAGPTGYHWNVLFVAIAVAVLGLVGVWALVRAQWSVTKAHMKALR